MNDFNPAVNRLLCALLLTWGSRGPVSAADSPLDRQLREFRDFAMSRDGNASRGRELFFDDQRVACAKCHSVDGTSSKAGPDLVSIGDAYPRGELIRSVLEPSASITVGYGTTTVVTKNEEEFEGIVKQATGEMLVLARGDGRQVQIAAADIKEHWGSSVSLMPEGLQAGLSRQEFADLIDYLVSLKQPASARAGIRGMPRDIPELLHPVAVRPFFCRGAAFSSCVCSPTR